ncbi:MAG: thermonuclease family protein [Xanthobacteraceae bacterium]
MRLCFAALMTIVLIAISADAAEFAGIPRIVDGDTLAIGPARIRLQGIDAPETDQVCLNASGQQWTCGLEARDRLAAHVAGREIRCVSTDIDVYGRELARCTVVGEDLNGWMVRWALAYVRYSSAYVTAEAEARTRQSGLWQGAFIAPWDWRHRNKTTVILGAPSVPVNAQSVLLPRSATEGAPSAECTIKGNVNATGERIYHMPGQEFYAKVRMDVGKGKRWFCTPEEAEAAGWRRALR